MNTNSSALIRTLLIYAVCVPLAVVIGYMLASPFDRSTFIYAGIFGMLLVFPLLIKWHQPLLLFSWHTGIVIFFLNGYPDLWLAMVPISLGISILERTLNSRMHFIRVPQITWPLICLIAVVVFTAKLNGGFGLRSFGSEIYGGKKYVFLFIAIASYFALTARSIPKERIWLCVGLFFLAPAINAVSDFAYAAPHSLRYLFLIFPPTYAAPDEFAFGTTRLGGVGTAGTAIYLWMVARYGLRGVFLSGKPWRILLLIGGVGLIFLGGYRSALLVVVFVFGMKFFMEGLHRTWLLPLFFMVGLTGLISIIPLAGKLPFTVQRTLAFLPFIPVDSLAKQNADDSTNWRLDMWKALLPQVPQHLLLGKGYAIKPEDYGEMMGQTALAFGVASKLDASQGSLSLSGDYHNGMLSVILPFGIWGVLAFLWFMIAGLRVMYCNYRYGDPALSTVNSLLFLLYLFEALNYFSCIGGLQMSQDIGLFFIGYLGLSIALNNGVRRPAPVTKPTPATQPGRPAPVFPRPVFQR